MRRRPLPRCTITDGQGARTLSALYLLASLELIMASWVLRCLSSCPPLDRRPAQPDHSVSPTYHACASPAIPRSFSNVSTATVELATASSMRRAAAAPARHRSPCTAPNGRVRAPAWPSSAFGGCMAGRWNTSRRFLCCAHRRHSRHWPISLGGSIFAHTHELSGGTPKEHLPRTLSRSKFPPPHHTRRGAADHIHR